MATRKPLVMVGGKPQQLPAGDTIAGALRLPVIKDSGGIAWIELSERGQLGLPVWRADGTEVLVPLEAVA